MSKIVDRGCVYMITYPNGKRYIGQDQTDDINYFGSAHAPTIAKDFTRKQRRDMTIRKQILWEGRRITVKELNRQEARLIAKHRTSDPDRGYNRSPRGRLKR